MGSGGILVTFLFGLSLACVLYLGESVIQCIITHTFIDAVIEPGLAIAFFHF